MREGLRGAFKRLWTACGAVVGFVLVVSGLILLFLPGPGLFVLLLGLGILAEREHAWARRHLEQLKTLARKLGLRVK